MLIRFVIENVFSFGERKEFNTIPHKRLKTLLEHKYDFDGFEVLKISSLYGANGAGKSNLVKALFLMKRLITKEEIPFQLKDSQFKFNPDPNNREQLLAVEFFQDGIPFYYGVVICDETIKTEELYLSGLGKVADKLLFERKTDENGQSSIQLLEEFEVDEKSQLLKSILIEEFVKPDEPVLKLLANRDNKYLDPVKIAFRWFRDTLQIVTPEAKFAALAHLVDVNGEFKLYAEEMLRSFNLGISSLTSEKKEIAEFFGEDNPEAAVHFKKRVEESPRKMINLRLAGAEHSVVKEGDKYWVKSLKVGHIGENDRLELFDLSEESDGTIRLLDFVPAFKNIISGHKLYVVDEIERSIHPLLIKELVKKFSLDPDTKGQLIFTTHESNLLDQELFRQDEIWFVEKDFSGSTDLYSLSEFKEHKTIDIRKGYLNGRYGSIPFLGNLRDLNWHQYDTDQSIV